MGVWLASECPIKESGPCVWISDASKWHQIREAVDHFQGNVMKFNRFAAAAATLVAMSAAQASVTLPGGNLGTLSVFPEQFVGFAASFQPKTFSDSYTFSLASTSNVYGSVSELFSIFGDLTFSQVLIDGFDTGPLTLTNTGFGFDFGPLAAGVHTLVVKGSILPGLSAYSGSIYAIPASIPEPSSVALLLGGLGLMGALGARKRLG